ncbi:MAG: SprT family zinc-dependent metalloprotease [Clostridiales bacterium]|jgi:predicted metal-dependent hydrolase|nr:SprT family zinc-dependent metalloprotease [Clostridiales bacterium]
MKDKHYIKIDDNRILYTLLKTKRKTIGISVDRNGEVKVSAPFRISEKQICEVVQKKADWIVKKVNEVRERNANTVCREFVSGEKFLYLGKEYTLEIVEKDLGKSEVFIQEYTMAVYISQGLSEESRKQAIKEALVKWYRQRFAEIVKERIDKYSLQLKVAPCKVVIKDQKTRWGSCSKKGNINLNWRLVMAPLDVIDYVVVHELCHLKVMNHSKDFWNLVESILPNYHESRKWLKVNGNRLGI